MNNIIGELCNRLNRCKESKLTAEDLKLLERDANNNIEDFISSTIRQRNRFSNYIQGYKNSTAAKIIEEEEGYEFNELEGGWGRWHNPNAKWDWWQIGGRWRGKLRVKEYINCARNEPEFNIVRCEETINRYYVHELACDQCQVKNLDLDAAL